MCYQPPLFGKHLFQKVIQQEYDVNPWITVHFGTSVWGAKCKKIFSAFFAIIFIIY